MGFEWSAMLLFPLPRSSATLLVPAAPSFTSLPPLFIPRAASLRPASLLHSLFVRSEFQLPLCICTLRWQTECSSGHVKASRNELFECGEGGQIGNESNAVV